MLTISVILFILTSCNIQDKAVATQNSTTIDNRDSVQPSKIIFLTYSMKKKETSEEYELSLLNKYITEGKLKVRNKDTIIPTAGDLEYKIIDQNEKLLKRNYIPNPMNKTIEFVTSEGELATTEIKSDSTEFFLRLQLDPNAKFIILERYVGMESKNIHLLTSEL